MSKHYKSDGTLDKRYRNDFWFNDLWRGLPFIGKLIMWPLYFIFLLYFWLFMGLKAVGRLFRKCVYGVAHDEKVQGKVQEFKEKRL